MDNKKINKWIGITATLLVIIVVCELGFILYIRMVNVSRQAQIEQTRLEIAYEDSVNRANMATHPRQETVAEHFNLKQNSDPLDDYIDKMVEKEIRALDAEEKKLANDSTSVIIADPELDENEDWESEGVVKSDSI